MNQVDREIAELSYKWPYAEYGVLKPPNSEQGWDELLAVLNNDLDTHGVAYLWKIPNDKGVVAELRRLDPECVRPAYDDKFINHGKLEHLFVTEKPGMCGWIKLPLSEVKVFRKEQKVPDHGPLPKGWSWIKPEWVEPEQDENAPDPKPIILAMLKENPNLLTDADLASVGLFQGHRELLHNLLKEAASGATDEELRSVGLMRIVNERGGFNLPPEVGDELDVWLKEHSKAAAAEKEMRHVMAHGMPPCSVCSKPSEECNCKVVPKPPKTVQWPMLDKEQPPPPDTQLPRGGFF